MSGTTTVLSSFVPSLGLMTLRFGTTISHSPRETYDLAFSIGHSLERPTIFFLEGNLGVGKTVFAKGLICGLGQADPDDVTSPSFTLVNEYALRFKVFHIDLYRLDTKPDLQSLDLEEIFAEPAIIVVEWADKLGMPELEDVICVKIEDMGNDDRKIEVRPQVLRKGAGGQIPA
jgi:tRNA threonylcarbamoyladenosine biosynthesis protein TsaE